MPRLNIIPILATFFICLFLVLGVSGIGETKNVTWQIKNGQSVLPSCTPYAVIGLIGFIIIARLLSIRSSNGEGNRTTALKTLDEPTEDSFDPSSVRTGRTPGTYTVSTYRGRQFVIGIDQETGNMAYQEVDTRGKPIGRPVMSSESDWRYGKDPRKELAEHLRREVEVKRR